MNDEAIFEALIGINWNSDNLQIANEEEPAQDDPGTSTSGRQHDVNPAGHNPDNTGTGLQE